MQEHHMDELSQSLRYLNYSLCTQADVNVNPVIPKENEYSKYLPFFGWKPLEVMRRTFYFEATTQFAVVCFGPPLCRHYKFQCPTLNKPWFREMCCTDTLFCSTPAIGGYTSAQLYYGVKSKFIALYPMTTESQGSDSLEDFYRDRRFQLSWRMIEHR